MYLEDRCSLFKCFNNKLLLSSVFVLFFSFNTNGIAQSPLLKGTNITIDEVLANKQKEVRNKQNVLNFFQLLMGDHDYDEAEKYMGEYIQHDPKVSGNGMAPLKKLLTTAPQYKNRPKGVQMHYHLVMAEGDYVYIQKRKEFPGHKMMVQHIFRLSANGLIDEHWTTVTSVDTDKGVNPQPLY